MSRSNYQNYPLTEKRQKWIATIAARLGLNPDDHGVRNQVLDFALEITVYFEKPSNK